MTARRFTTTRLSGLRVAGRAQELQHATVAPFLERELGPEYGRLFADFEAESSDVRAWYTEADAPPRAIATLPEAEAEAMRQRVADMVGRIADFAARIAGESTQKANLARILTAATTFPIEAIWAAGAQPIIVNWGFHRHDVAPGVPSPIRERIGRPRAGRPGNAATGAMDAGAMDAGAVDAGAAGTAAADIGPAAGAGSGLAEPVPVYEIFAHHQGPHDPIAARLATRRAMPIRRTGYVLPALLWLAFCAFAGACYALLLPACGLAGLTGLGNCPLAAGGTQVFSEGIELQALVEAAELEATRRDALCRAPRRAGLLGPDRSRTNGAAGFVFVDDVAHHLAHHLADH